MLELLFSLSFLFTGGHVLDTKFNLHKYEKNIYKEIFYLKNKESVNVYCIKHSKIENLIKEKCHRPGGGKQTCYKLVKQK